MGEMKTRGSDRRLTDEQLRARRERHAVLGQRLRAPDTGVGGLALSEWQAILDHWGHCCAYCGRCPTGEGKDVMHMDHVEPLCRGGTNTAPNVVPACYVCNASKVDLLLLEWVCRRIGLLCGRSHGSLRAANRTTSDMRREAPSAAGSRASTRASATRSDRATWRGPHLSDALQAPLFAW